MNVYYDARFIHPTRHDGIGRYSLELLKAYARINPKVTMIIYDLEQLKRLPKLNYVTLSDPQKIGFLKDARRLNKLGVDVVFSPMQIFGSFGRKFKLILSLHDTIFYQYRKPPHRLNLFEKLGWRLFHLTSLPQRFVLNRADVVVTVSQTSRHEIEKLHLTDRPIFVVSNASIPAVIAPKQTEKILVYMGSFMEYKNVETLVQAMRFLPDYQLILCSKIDNKRRKNLLSYAKNTEQIVFKNGVSDEEYLDILSRATALLSASRAEGFNLSPIEAMSAGTPVIISHLPIHNEIAGSAALLFDPDNINELADRVRELEDPKKRAEMIKKGKEKAAKFSWDKSAAQLDKIICDLAK